MEQQKQHKPFKSRMILAIVNFLARLPVPLSRLVLRPLAWLQIYTSNRTRRVTDINLDYCNIQVEGKSREQIRNESIIHSTNLIAESSWIWAHDYTENRKMIGEFSIHDSFLESNNGNLLISPHLGNWELVYAYLSNEFNCGGLYKPPDIPELDELILKGRGGEVFPTDTAGVRRILKWLKTGGSLFLLPDQHPPEGSGVFAEFFGQPAYSMTLLHGLVKRTRASLWMAYAIKINNTYSLQLYPLDIDPELTPEAFNTELNQCISEAIMKAPDQYQWGYKRFKKTQDGSASIYDR